MGSRYILELECPKCGATDDEVYFAPTCGIDDWQCPKCKYIVDLCEETGMSYEDCSNADLISDVIDDMTKK